MYDHSESGSRGLPPTLIVTLSKKPNSLKAIPTNMFDKPGAIPTSQRIELAIPLCRSGVCSLNDKSTIF